MASATLNLDTEQLKAVTEILAGAAWADDQFHGLEAEAIGRIITEHADDEYAASAVKQHLAGFDKATFDVNAACKRVGLETDAERAALISLVARVTDADFTHDFAESDYIASVAEALGLDASSIKEHTVEEVKVSFSIPKPS
jgi:uncharacterized tellurite resistance protein B-like protein